MKIGELASHTGLNASAIPYHEKCGLLAIPYRIRGQRRYAADVVPRILLIRFASNMGFTLGQIKVFLNGLENGTAVGPRWRKLAHYKIKELDETIRRSRRLKSLIEHLLRCQCASLQVRVGRLSLSPSLRLIRDRTD